MLPPLARTVREFLRLNQRLTYEELRSALAEHGVQDGVARLAERLVAIGAVRHLR